MELTPEQAADAVELHPCPNCQSPPDSLAGLDPVSTPRQPREWPWTRHGAAVTLGR